MIEKLMFKTMIICNNSIDLIFFVNQNECQIRHRGQVSDDGWLHKSINFAEFKPFLFAADKTAQFMFNEAFGLSFYLFSQG